MKIFRFLKIACGMVLLVVAGWGGHTVWRYLRTAPRFEATRILPLGLKHVTESQVTAAARSGLEESANVFAIDLDAMRERVEGLLWVQHALVERVLPNQITIKVVEREPVGLARVGGEIRQFDLDGVLLDPPGVEDVAELSLPVLDGMKPGDEVGNRRRAELYKKAVTELGPKGLSEVRFDEGKGEVVVVSNFDPILVSLGSEEWLSRWVRFLRMRAYIRREYPDAAAVDLRFQEQVIVRKSAGSPSAGRSVRWGGEKKNAL